MKKSKKRVNLERPSVEELQKEVSRVRYKRRYKSVLKSTVYSLIVVAAIAVLVATIWMPVLQIYGNSMNPTLTEGDIVVSVKGDNYKSGDLVSFYLGNKLLIKRYIAGAGQWVDIDKDGNVFVDGEYLDEPYVNEKCIGEADIMFPYQVPESRIFVLGDHRFTSVDSRSASVGCVADEQMVGKIVFRVWPLSKIGRLK